MKILVTGFKPFLGEKINPSEKLAVELAESFDHVESLILPVEFRRSFEILNHKILGMQPDRVFMLGQALGRKNICLEKIGLNWVQSENRDEVGVVPKTGRIVENVELALMAKFPIEKVFLELKRNNFPVEVSFSAGTYVCNDLYFRILNEFRDLEAVFVHVPPLPEQLKADDVRPSLEYTTQVEILKFLLLMS